MIDGKHWQAPKTSIYMMGSNNNWMSKSTMNLNAGRYSNARDRSNSNMNVVKDRRMSNPSEDNAITERSQVSEEVRSSSMQSNESMKGSVLSQD